MSKDNLRWLEKQLPDLLQEGVIDAATDQRLRRHFNFAAAGTPAQGAAGSLSLVTIILAAIGGLLIGGGIILIFAHNWQHIGRPMRAALAFAPLLAAQALAVMAIFPRRRGQAWREVAGVLLFCAVPAAIALIGAWCLLHLAQQCVHLRNSELTIGP